VYGVRRPVRYHLFETEMESVSVFNGEALRLFSFGAFVLSIFLNIGLIVIFAPAPLSAAVSLYAFWGLILTGGLSLLCFAFGGWALYSKQSIIKQIMRETVAKANGCKGKMKPI